MRVLVIANNLQQASYRVRIEALRDELARRDIFLDVQLRPRNMLHRRRLLRSARGFDAVILQRKLLDPADARLLRRSAAHIFFDVDDAVMYHNRDVGPLARWRTWRRFLATARNVDHVVAGNEHLADLFQRQSAVASVIPTVVEIERYAPRSHAPTDAPALVWIGSRSTLPYLQRLGPALVEARLRCPALHLIVVADQSIDLAPLPVEFVPWSVEGEAAALSRGDIGIAPTPCDRWTMGKCGFKIVQYMAAGLPVIASPVGANAQIVVDEETGLLPVNWSDWPATIVRLSADAGLRAQMGLRARQRVARCYSIQTAAALWENLLKAVGAASSQRAHH